ncbi:hypothetical protein Athai_50090 [Actinocatenispora thailandica]|uniref:DUF2254 domain-containing protein n=1 Tax=Actinocatenispora thailandica TaxID=227318 RepID=A0A7R7HZH5_9ACTN|nr:hypothetical protein Athai_50090 [Actinocatenispora thailandica]
MAGVILGVLLPTIHSGPTVNADKVTGILQAMAAGLVALTGLVFSLLSVVVRHVSTNLSPRLMLFRDHPLVWHALGLFVGVLLFSVSASLQVSHDRRMSLVVPVVAVLLVLCCMAVGGQLQLRALSAVQFESVLQRVTGEGLQLLARLYPASYDAAPAPAPLPPVSRAVSWPYRYALLQQVDLPALSALAEDHGCTIVLGYRPGVTIPFRGTALRVHGPDPGVPDAELLGALDVGVDRTFDQDPLLAFRLLNDIALRALSTAVNDPYTAVRAVDGMADLLRAVADRDLDIGTVRDDRGRPLVVAPLPGWPRFVAAATEILPYLTAAPMVRARVLRMLDETAAAVPPDRRAELTAAAGSLR